MKVKQTATQPELIGWKSERARLAERRSECVQANKSSSGNASASNMQCVCVCLWCSSLKMQYILPHGFRFWLHGMAQPPSGNLFGKCYAKHAPLRRTQIKHLVWSMSHNIKCRCWNARRCDRLMLYFFFRFAWLFASFFTLILIRATLSHCILSTRNKVTQTRRREKK